MTPDQLAVQSWASFSRRPTSSPERTYKIMNYIIQSQSAEREMAAMLDGIRWRAAQHDDPCDDWACVFLSWQDVRYYWLKAGIDL